jgi:flagellar biogenesis protein FliO
VKPGVWILALACLGIGVSSRPSFALEPAGGPPEAALDESSDDPPDASVGDEASSGDELAPELAPAERSWLGRGPMTGAPGASQSAPASQGSGFTLGALLIVLGLGAAAIILRYRRRRLGSIPTVQSRLTVLSSSRIGPKAFAVSAQVGGRVLLLGVTDHSVSHLGWLDSVDADAIAPLDSGARREPGDTLDAAEDLPDDYPGSALRAASGGSAPLASAKNLKRFREVLEGAVRGRPEPPLRPQNPFEAPSAASTLAAQTNDVFTASSGTRERAATIPSLRRQRQRRRQSLPPENVSAQPVATGASEPLVEGQVRGLSALRNGG